MSTQDAMGTRDSELSRVETLTEHHPPQPHQSRPHVDRTRSRMSEAAVGAVEDTDEQERAIRIERRDTDKWSSNPANPRTWSLSKKWSIAGIVSMYTFVSPLASSMVAPALLDISVEFGIRNATLLAFVVSVFLLAFAIGPLFLAPISEIYGRRWVLNIANVVFLIFNVACALAPNTAALIVFRFLGGLAGSAPLTIGAGVIADLFDEESRAAALGVFSMGPLVGPVVGPVAGGFIAEDLGYAWVFWIIAIVAGVTSLVGIPLLQETYHPVIIARLNKKEGKELPLEDRASAAHLFWVNISRPLVLLTHSLICFALSLYMAVVYGVLYLMFVTFPELYADVYGWKAGVSGLAYLGPGIGFFLGVVIGSQASNVIYFRLIERNNGVAEPEFRLPMVFLGSLLMPAGLLWYGWSADQHTHWIVPILGSGVFAFGMLNCFLPIQVYLVDSFKYAASATAAAAFLRSLFGVAFPLFGDRIFDSLGVGGGYSLIAGLTIVVGWPFPLLIYFKGKSLRARSDLNR